MFYVYLLKSVKFDRKYIGCTSDLRKRFSSHNSGLINSTKNFKPWKLVYYEAFVSKYDAFNREKDLKQNYTTKRHLLTRVKDSLENN